MDEGWSLSIRRPCRSEDAAASVSAMIAATVVARLSVAPLSG